LKRRIIAVCGKGGVGKTTVSAIIAQHLARREGVKTLVVDADPAGGLAMALGFKSQFTLNDIRRETIEEIRRGETDKQDLAASIDYRLWDAIHEHGRLAFFPIGRPEEIGCYCSVNSLLRRAIELLAEEFQVILIDAEAGIEQINRQVMSQVDTLLLVSDRSLKGLRVIETIADVAGNLTESLGVHLLLNRITSTEQAGQVAGNTDLPLAGWAPEDETVARFDAEGLSFFDLPECPAAKAIVEVLAKLQI